MRKVLQYAFEVVGSIDDANGYVESYLHAFCDDGTIWYWSTTSDEWIQTEIGSVPGTFEEKAEQEKTHTINAQTER